jgi:hypothetical protein
MRPFLPGLCLAAALGLNAQMGDSSPDPGPYHYRTGQASLARNDSLLCASSSTAPASSIFRRGGSATRSALLSFMQSGKRLVVYHHSAASFWTWRSSRSVWRTTQSHHSPVHAHRVDIRDVDHPIARGMASFIAQTDVLRA